MSSPDLSVVIPAHGEAAQLRPALAALRNALEDRPESYEVLVVDDGSQDATWQVLEEARADHPELWALSLSRNFGKEAALRAGLEAARGRAVVVMDADLQHPPDRIPEMLRLWSEEGAKVVSAVKSSRGAEPFLLRVAAAGFYSAFFRVAGCDLRGASDFKLLDREVVDALNDLPERGTFFRGLVPWLGFPERRVEFSVPPRAGGGGSRWSLRALVELGLTALTAFSAAPLRVVSYLGVGFLVFAAVLGAQTLWNWGRGVSVSGFTTVILLQLVIGSALMLSLGVLGEYVARIFEEVKRRPAYVVARRLPPLVRNAPP